MLIAKPGKGTLYWFFPSEIEAHPPDLRKEAVKTVLRQAELLCADWRVAPLTHHGSEEVTPGIVTQAAPRQPEPGAQGDESNLETLA